MADCGVYLQVDATELTDELEKLKKVMTPEQFDKAMYGIFKRTGSHVKKILGVDIPQSYDVSKAQVRQTVKTAKVVSSGMGVSGVGCTIPVEGERKHIGGGGKGFTAYGGRRGWNSLNSGHYSITTKVLKGKRSTLPKKLSSYGGMPPFRNLGSSLNGITFTRAGKDRLPIEPVMGIAIPQMPLNRSEGDVQSDIKKYMQQRIEARLNALIKNGK